MSLLGELRWALVVCWVCSDGLVVFGRGVSDFGGEIDAN